MTAVEGGAGKPGLGGGGVAPLTVRVSGVLKTAPVESQACTTTLCVPDPMATEISSLLAEMR
jgi:hypothetical protein